MHDAAEEFVGFGQTCYARFEPGENSAAPPAGSEAERNTIAALQASMGSRIVVDQSDQRLVKSFKKRSTWVIGSHRWPDCFLTYSYSWKGKHKAFTVMFQQSFVKGIFSFRSVRVHLFMCRL